MAVAATLFGFIIGPMVKRRDSRQLVVWPVSCLLPFYTNNLHSYIYVVDWGHYSE